MSEQNNQGTQTGNGGQSSGDQNSGGQTQTQNVVSFDWMKKGNDGKGTEKR